MKITTHSDPLNMRATFLLNGIHAGDEKALVDLFRSDVQLDRATRDALADALERRRGLRLKLVREKGFQNKPTLIDEIRPIAEYQEIAAEVTAEAELEAERRGIDQKRCQKHAKDVVAMRRGISLGKVKDALREAQRTRAVQIRRVPRIS